MLSVTAVIPLTYIAFEWSEAGRIFFSGLSTLALPTALFGHAMGQVFYQQSLNQFAQNKSFDRLLLSNLKLLLLLGVPCFHLYIFWSVYVRFGFRSAVGRGRENRQLLHYCGCSFIFHYTIRTLWHYGKRLVVRTCLAFFSVDHHHFSCWAILVLKIYLFGEFLYLLILQVSVMHIIDGMASFLFAKRSEAFSLKMPHLEIE